MSHTPEPWEAVTIGATLPGIRQAGARDNVDNARIASFSAYDTGAQSTANRDRAVECVNALAGIEDPSATLKLAREALSYIVSSVNLGGAIERNASAYRIAGEALAALGGDA